MVLATLFSGADEEDQRMLGTTWLAIGDDVMNKGHLADG